MFRKITYDLIDKWEKGGKVRKLLCALKNCNDTYQREAIIAALGRIGDPRAVAPIAEWISKGRFELDLNVTEALGRIGTSDAIALLIEWLDSPKVNYLASSALMKAAETVKDLSTLMAIAKGRLNSNEQLVAIIRRIDEPDFYKDYVANLLFDDYLYFNELSELVTKKVNEPGLRNTIIATLQKNNAGLRPYHYETKWEPCPTCDGKGWWRGMEDTDCMACEGTGRQKVEVKVYDEPEIAASLNEKEAKGTQKAKKPGRSVGGAIRDQEESESEKIDENEGYSLMLNGDTAEIRSAAFAQFKKCLSEGGNRILSAIIELKVDQSAAAAMPDSWPSAKARFQDLIEKYGSCDNASVYLHYSSDSQVIVHADSGKDEYHHHIIRTDIDAFIIEYELTYWG